tara:strand:- start:287 stop:574 length:288 start_codon:yes stop_codon:yes gene_type:complete
MKTFRLFQPRTKNYNKQFHQSQKNSIYGLKANLNGGWIYWASKYNGKAKGAAHYVIMCPSEFTQERLQAMVDDAGILGEVVEPLTKEELKKRAGL